VQWKKVTLAGVGLLGGSLGLALRQRRLAAHVTGLVRRKESIKECFEKGVVDHATIYVREAVSGSDLIVLCTPPSRMEPMLNDMLPYLSRGAIVTDVGSVKKSLVSRLEKIAAKGGVRFVGSHPMAGGEKMGVAHARADLFANAVCVVTPSASSDAAAVQKIALLWKSVGSRVLKMSPAEHDKLVSRTSHLPHVLAAVLSQAILAPATISKIGPLCANGFRDTTRVASGSPEMWRDIVMANRQNLLGSLRDYDRELERFKKILKTADAKALLRFFESAKHRRDGWVAGCNSQSSE
jgi:prephenate dehydrogenase